MNPEDVLHKIQVRAKSGDRDAINVCADGVEVERGKGVLNKKHERANTLGIVRQVLAEEYAEKQSVAAEAQVRDDLMHIARAQDGQPFDPALSTAASLREAQRSLVELMARINTTYYPVAEQEITLAEIALAEAETRYHAHVADLILTMTAEGIIQSNPLDDSIQLDPTRGLTGRHRAASAEAAAHAQRLRDHLPDGTLIQ